MLHLMHSRSLINIYGKWMSLLIIYSFLAENSETNPRSFQIRATDSFLLLLKKLCSGWVRYTDCWSTAIVSSYNMAGLIWQCMKGEYWLHWKKTMLVWPVSLKCKETIQFGTLKKNETATTKKSTKTPTKTKQKTHGSVFSRENVSMLSSTSPLCSVGLLLHWATLALRHNYL